MTGSSDFTSPDLTYHQVTAVFLAEYQGRQVAVKAVHGLRGQTDLAHEDGQRSRREGMVQVWLHGYNFG